MVECKTVAPTMWCAVLVTDGMAVYGVCVQSDLLVRKPHPSLVGSPSSSIGRYATTLKDKTGGRMQKLESSLVSIFPDMQQKTEDPRQDRRFIEDSMERTPTADDGRRKPDVAPPHHPRPNIARDQDPERANQATELPIIQSITHGQSCVSSYPLAGLFLVAACGGIREHSRTAGATDEVGNCAAEEDTSCLGGESYRRPSSSLVHTSYSTNLSKSQPSLLIPPAHR